MTKIRCVSVKGKWSPWYLITTAPCTDTCKQRVLWGRNCSRDRQPIPGTSCVGLKQKSVTKKCAVRPCPKGNSTNLQAAKDKPGRVTVVLASRGERRRGGCGSIYQVVVILASRGEERREGGGSGGWWVSIYQIIVILASRGEERRRGEGGGGFGGGRSTYICCPKANAMNLEAAKDKPGRVVVILASRGEREEEGRGWVGSIYLHMLSQSERNESRGGERQTR